MKSSPALPRSTRYLIAFFRGQILVTMIDGAILGALLFYPVRLNFALLIGLLVAVLQLVPYMGILLCWIPAVLIALAQFGDWQHPLLVTVIFIVVSNLDGFLIAPRIVGEAVGLHPVTIIVSVFLWTLLIGGLLGRAAGRAAHRHAQGAAQALRLGAHHQSAAR